MRNLNNKMSLVSAFLFLFSAICYADDPGAVVGETMKVPGDYVSDFPNEVIMLQVGQVRYDYNDIVIPGSGGLDIVHKRTVKYGGIGSHRPWFRTEHLFATNKPKATYSCLGTVNKIKMFNNGQRLDPMGYNSTAQLPNGVVVAFDDYSVLLCREGKPILKLPNGRTIKFEERIVESSDLFSNSFYFISEIKDRFGNYIKYEYEDDAPNSQSRGRRLKTITRNDGVKLDFSYSKPVNASTFEPERLTAINYLGKKIQYEYENGRHSAFIDAEGRKTKYKYGLHVGLGYLLKSVETPDGALIEYKHHPVFEKTGFRFPDPTNPLKIDLTDYGYTSGGLVSKKISGLGLKTRTFYYDLPGYGKEPSTGEDTQLYVIHEHDFEKDLELSTEYAFSIAPKRKGQLVWVRQFVGVIPPLTHRFKYQDGELIYSRVNAWKKINQGDVGCTIIADKTDAEVFFDCGKYARSSQIVKVKNGSSMDAFVTNYTKHNIYGGIEHYNESNHSTKKRYYQKSFKNDVTDWVLNLPTVSKISESGSHYFPFQEKTYHDETTSDGKFKDKHLVYEEKLYGTWVKRYVDYHSNGDVLRTEFNEYLKNASGIKTPNYRYQEFISYKQGIPTKTNFPARYSSSSIVSESQEVDGNGWITSKTDLNGNTTNYGYDKIGRLIYIDKPNNWLDQLIEWSYSSVGNLVRKESHCILTKASDSCVSGSLNLVRQETFDALKRLVVVEERDTIQAKSRFKNYTYNVFNKPTFSSFWSESSTDAKGRIYTYDALSRVLSIEEAGTATEEITYLSNNTIRVKKPMGSSTDTSYLSYGVASYDTPTKIVSPEGVTTDIAVNLFGNIESITQSGKDSNNNDISLTEYRAYNNYQQLCKVKRSDVGQTVYYPNVLGEVLWQVEGTSGGTNTDCVATLAEEDKTKFSYDNLGDMYQAIYPNTSREIQDGFTRTYSYDNNGNLKQITSGSVTQNYNYNSLNLLEDETLSVDGKIFTLDYGYNEAGHLKSLTYPDKDVVTFVPNGFGQPTQAVRSTRTLPDSSQRPEQNYATKASYYPTGQVDSFTYGNKLIHKTSLNNRKLPESITDGTSSKKVLDYSYKYDNNLNITKLTDNLASTYSLTNLTYDGLDRLKTTSGGDSIGSSSIQYDALGNITHYTSKDRSLNYKYNYATNHLTSVSGIQEKYASFVYDKRGNIYGNGKHNFTYNLANQMISSGSNHYVYDGYNRRVKKTAGADTEYSLYSQDGTLLYRETKDGGINYIYLGKKLIAKDGVIPENSGKQHYRPYGESIEGEADDVGYTGHKFDTDIGLSYMQARYYDPVIGRFYSNDPVGFTGEIDTFNRYSYVANNPYKYTDPNGEEKVTAQFAFGIAAKHGFGFSVALSYDTVHKEISFDRSFSYKSGGAIKASGGFVVAESAANSTGNSSSTKLEANLNYNASANVGPVKFEVGDSTNLLGAQFDENGVTNTSGQSNASGAMGRGMEDTTLSDFTIGAGVDISAEAKVTRSTTVNIPETIKKIKETF